jgi:uncharacterized protein involved in response to NO
MLNITDLKKEEQLMPLLRLGFRPFFLFGSIFALTAIAIWTMTLAGIISPTPLNGAFWWHSHEMLFGFVPAIISGFLLTAVQTWTGIPSVKGRKLLFLVVLWMAARILLLVNLNISIYIIMLIDLSFLPLTGVFLGLPLFKIKQYRNMVFLPVLALMAVANLLSYLPQLGYSSEFSTKGFHGMVMLATLMVALLGGRVIPMFTANGTGTQKVLPIKWLEFSSLASLLLIFIFLISGLSHFTIVTAVICFISACLHLFRILRWRVWVTFSVPLVWILHLTMIFIPIGLFMMAAHFAFSKIMLSTALHCLTVGVMGGMIIAMMSRVSLGHTGRMLKASPVIVFGFISILLATLVRTVAVALMPEHITQLWLLAGIFWCLTFACFIWVYLPILSAPRVDGRPG